MAGSVYWDELPVDLAVWNWDSRKVSRNTVSKTTTIIISKINCVRPATLCNPNIRIWRQRQKQYGYSNTFDTLLLGRWWKHQVFRNRTEMSIVAFRYSSLVRQLNNRIACKQALSGKSRIAGVRWGEEDRVCYGLDASKDVKQKQATRSNQYRFENVVC